MAGALRLTLSAEPGSPVVGQPAVFSVLLANLGDTPLVDLTLDVTASSQTVVESLEALLGQTTRVGPLVRWYIPQLAAGGEAALQLKGSVKSTAGRSVQICVMLLSAGAPVEHCAAFQTLSAPPTPFGVQDGPAFPTAVPAGILDERAPVNTGWLLLLLGAGALGLWLGMQRRAQQEGPREGEG